MSKGEIFEVSLLEKLITFELALEEYLDQQSFGHGSEVSLNIGDGSIALERVLVSVLNKYLRQNVEVFLVFCMEGFDHVVDGIDMLELELVLLQEFKNLDDFVLHDFVGVDWLLVLVGVELLEGRLVVLEVVFELFGDDSVLPPDLSLPVELVDGVLEEALVGLAEVVVVGGEDFLGPGHGVEGLPVVVDFEVADAHVGECEGVGGEVLDRLFVALDGLLVVVHVFVDVSEVVVGVAIAGVDFDGSAVPVDGLVGAVGPLVDDGDVVVGGVVLGVGGDALLVVLEGLLVVPHFVVGDARGVVQLVNVLGQQVETVVGLHVVLEGHVVLALVVVAEAQVVVIVVRVDLVLPHLGLDLLVVVVQLVKHVAHVLVGRLVLLVLLDAPEVPLDRQVVVLLQLVVDPDVVVAGGVLGCHLRALRVPADGLVIHLLGPSVDDPDLVQSTSVLRVQLRHSLQLLNLVVGVLLVAGQDEKSHSVFRLIGHDLVGGLRGLGLLDSFVLVDVGDALKGSHPSWLHLPYLVVLLDGLFVDGLVAQNVGVAQVQLVAVRMSPNHGSVPLDSVLHDLFLGLAGEVGQGKQVVGRSVVVALLDVLLVPVGNEPLIVSDGYFVVSQPVDLDFEVDSLLNVLLVEGDGSLELLAHEMLVGLSQGRVLEGVHGDSLLFLHDTDLMRIIAVQVTNKRIPVDHSTNSDETAIKGASDKQKHQISTVTLFFLFLIFFFWIFRPYFSYFSLICWSSTPFFSSLSLSSSLASLAFS